MAPASYARFTRRRCNIYSLTAKLHHGGERGDIRTTRHDRDRHPLLDVALINSWWDDTIAANVGGLKGEKHEGVPQHGTPTDGHGGFGSRGGGAAGLCACTGPGRRSDYSLASGSYNFMFFLVFRTLYIAILFSI